MTSGVRWRVAAMALAVCVGLVPVGAAHGSATVGPTATAGSTGTANSTAPGAVDALPVFAFYYQWFDPSSWNRAKTDYPELGRYSSDDPTVMRQHILWAKAAGITGFIVSWKDTPVNDRRLRG